MGRLKPKVAVQREYIRPSITSNENVRAVRSAAAEDCDVGALLAKCCQAAEAMSAVG